MHDDTPIFAMGVLFFAWVYGHWRAPDASAARGTLFLLSSKITCPIQKGEIIIKIRKGNNITKTKYNKKTSLLIIGKSKKRN